MTPGINVAKKKGVPYQVHEYIHDKDNECYGLEAAEKLGVSQQRVFKTLVLALDNKTLAVAVIPVSSMLSMKRLAQACGAKKAAMADKLMVQRSTGYVLGGVSPLGQKKRLKTIIDASAREFATIYVSAGRRGVDIELSPDDLAKLTSAAFFDLCQ
jgi:Cys-tRNA(Pro)/Cys-tRNA(Cys) deacylase